MLLGRIVVVPRIRLTPSATDKKNIGCHLSTVDSMNRRSDWLQRTAHPKRVSAAVRVAEPRDRNPDGLKPRIPSIQAACRVGTCETRLAYRRPNCVQSRALQRCRSCRAVSELPLDTREKCDKVRHFPVRRMPGPKNRSQSRHDRFRREWSDRMPTIILYIFRLLRLVGSGHQAIAIENLALRRQLAAYRRKRKRPLLTQCDRWFWIGLSYVWKNWRDALVFVEPDTVLRWQRDRFRRFWTRLSNSNGRRPGRPSITKDIRRLILQMAVANPLWRAAHPWRTADAWHRRFRTHGLPSSSHRAATAIAKLEDVSEKPPGRDRFRRFLHRGDCPATGFIRFPCSAAPP